LPVRNALSSHEHWPQLWRSVEPRSRYEVVIVGGGGHGLATAYYLAKEHGIRNVAVIEKGWLGGGNTGRNTTSIPRAPASMSCRCGSMKGFPATSASTSC
jgi:glycine/D-amino acid oxidase-like deaminating enzyme